MTKKNLSTILVISLIIFLLSPVSTHALTAIRTTEVSVTVGDLVPPTAPILIAPENGAYIATNQPNFIFLASSDDNSGIAYYQLFLDGELYINNITSDLSTIIVTAISQLSEGEHSWYVKVWDKAGNFAISSTWYFTVDTTPPFIIITTIEENTNLNFSSIDLTTVPPEITLTTRSPRPTFIGRGEPGATIQINLQDKKSYKFITTVSEDGSFVLVPDQDLANDTYEVTVVSFDKAGNTTLLPSFKLVVEAPPIIAIPIVSCWLCWLIVFLLLIIIAILSFLYYRERKRHQEHHQ